MTVAVDSRQFKHAIAVAALPIDSVCESDLRLSQCSGLVNAEHVHGAEIVDRGQPLDDDLLQRHTLGAACKCHRHYHRQQLGCEADCQRHGKQDGLHGRPV